MTNNALTLNLPKDVDQLSAKQKAVAGGLVLGVGYVVYLLLPPLIVFLTNLWLVALLLAPILYIAAYPTVVWGVFKTVSLKLTNSIIGLDPISALERYVDWYAIKTIAVEESATALKAQISLLAGKLTSKETAYKDNLKMADVADRNEKPLERDMYLKRASSDKESYDNLLPLVERGKERVELLTQIHEAMAANHDSLKYSVENKKDEYSALQAFHKGMKTADGVITDVGGQKFLFEEGIKQLNTQVANMTAQIETFEKHLKPVLTNYELESKVAEDEGRKLLEAFRQNKFN